MFVQIIRARTTKAAAVKALDDRWLTELAPGATGWLGTTAGVSADGRLFVLARFESEPAARRNSDRPEQGRWWAEMQALLDGEASFAESTEVDVQQVGDLDGAGFVQVISGRSSDPDRARELMQQSSPEIDSFRPDILGSVSVGEPDGAYTSVIYFTSEAEARAGEAKEPPPEAAEMMQQMMALTIGEPDYLDLTDPWLSSPG